jgi:integrase
MEAAQPCFSMVMPKRQNGVRHNPAMDYRDVPAFMRRLEERGGVVARALRLTILCGLRKNEVLGLRWSDIAGDVLTIPSERMKMKREHKVALSAAAMAVLEEQKTRGASAGLVFPSPIDPSKPLNILAFNDLLRSMGVDATPHGFRASFASWAQEQTDASVEVIEGVLAHVWGTSTTRAYLRSDNFDRRAELLRKWGEFLTCTGARTA